MTTDSHDMQMLKAIATAHNTLLVDFAAMVVASGIAPAEMVEESVSKVTEHLHAEFPAEIAQSVSATLTDAFGQLAGVIDQVRNRRPTHDRP